VLQERWLFSPKTHKEIISKLKAGEQEEKQMKGLQVVWNKRTTLALGKCRQGLRKLREQRALK
jgi:hypothetical protein